MLWCQFDDDKYDRWLSRIEHKIDKLLARQQMEIQQMADLAADVQDAVDAVAAQTTVVGSVKTLLDQLVAMITTLKGQIADPAAVAALEGAITQLKANSQALTDAVTANTPSA